MNCRGRLMSASICLVLCFIAGCSKSRSPESVKAAFENSLCKSSSKWSVIDWQAFNEPAQGKFDVRATYTVDGNAVYFHCLTTSSKSDIDVFASSQPAEPGFSGRTPTGSLLAIWHYRNGAILVPKDQYGDAPEALAQPAKEVATALHHSLP